MILLRGPPVRYFGACFAIMSGAKNLTAPAAVTKSRWSTKMRGSCFVRQRMTRRLVTAALAAALLGLATLWTAREGRWRSPLYCIERTGLLWGGVLGAVPAGWQAQCPQTASYRAEVRRRESRPEQAPSPVLVMPHRLAAVAFAFVPFPER